MRRLVGVVVAAVALAGVPEARAAAKIKVFMLQGGGHNWKANLPILAGVLEKTGDFEVTMSRDLDELKPENIKKYDVVFFYGSRLNFTDPAQEKGLLEFVRNGGGFVGSHSASDSFKKSDAYWEMLGGRFAGHGHGKFTVTIDDPDHPITKGLGPFEITDESYRHRYYKGVKLHFLASMTERGEKREMAWVREYGKGRVFYSANGHGREAWTNPAWQRLMVRGFYWAAGREPKDPPK